MRTEEALRRASLPRQFGRYEVITGLGKGGMARVYLAVQRSPFGATKLVAIKQLRSDVEDNELFVSQFVDEARIALRLNHPNVVHTYDVIVDPTQPFMAMEFLEGLPLSEILHRVGYEAIPLDLQVWVLTQVLTGLHYAHELRDFDGAPLHIVHRDVSPSNVFVTYAGDVKLLDFGIAKATNALSSTQNGIVKGKIGYAAPEQLLGHAVDARTDVYAVATMLWEAMARRRRWSGGTYQSKLQERMDHDGPPIEEVWSEVAPPLAAICRRALSRELGERHTTALDLKQELDAHFAFSSRGVDVQRLGAFMAENFRDNAIALRRKISEWMAGQTELSLEDAHLPMEAEPVERETASLAPRSDPPSLALSRERERPKATMRPSPLRKLALPIAGLLAVAAIVVASVGVTPRGRQGFIARPSQSTGVEPQATVASEAEGTPSAIAAPDVPQAAALEFVPAAATNPRARVQPGAPSMTSSHPVTRDVTLGAQRTLDGGLAKAAWRGDTPEEPDPIEPGMELRVRSTTHVKGKLDERDPYAR